MSPTRWTPISQSSLALNGVSMILFRLLRNLSSQEGGAAGQKAAASQTLGRHQSATAASPRHPSGKGSCLGPIG